MINYIFENRCFICNKQTENDFFCSSCLEDFNFIPYKNFIKYNDNFYFDEVFTLLENNEVLKKAIHLYKFGNIRKLSVFFSKLILKRYKKSFFDKYDYVVPVPLHKKKLKKRGFNQTKKILSEFLEEEKIFNFAFRARNTKQQSLIKSREERKKNIFNVFEIEYDKINLIKNKKILLFDDIFTTGTTLNELAKTFFYSEAQKIDILIIGVS